MASRNPIGLGRPVAPHAFEGGPPSTPGAGPLSKPPGFAGVTSDGRRAVFALDASALRFAPYWRGCMADRWITILNGAMKTAWCATRRGQARRPTKDEIGAG